MDASGIGGAGRPVYGPPPPTSTKKLLPNTEQQPLDAQPAGEDSASLERKEQLGQQGQLLPNKLLAQTSHPSAQSPEQKEPQGEEVKKRKERDFPDNTSSQRGPVLKKAKLEDAEGGQVQNKEPGQNTVQTVKLVPNFGKNKLLELTEDNSEDDDSPFSDGDAIDGSDEEFSDQSIEAKDPKDLGKIFKSIIKIDAEEFTSDDFNNFHSLINSERFSTNAQLLEKKAELLKQINDMPWEKELATGFSGFMESGDVSIENCDGLCCIHHTLLSLQIEGARTAKGESPLELYMNNAGKDGIVENYAQMLGFTYEGRVMEYNDRFEEKLIQDEAYENTVLDKLGELTDDKISNVPKNRIFFANEDPAAHTWFANQAGPISGAIFTSLNVGQSPAQENVTLASIMQGNGKQTPYALTQTCYSDIFVARPAPEQ